MAYQSEFEGAQMEAAFHRVTNMLTGTTEITASINGHGYAFVRGVYFGGAAPKVFASVRGLDSEISASAGVSPQYNAADGVLLLQLFGEGINGGERYAVDFLLVE